MYKNALAYMESFYMALADKTRLRILNLMREGEVCVCFFTEVLGDSQPKISRHLAYLRNAGIVKARRDGKWMHYSIINPDSEGGRRALEQALAWLADQSEMRAELDKYRKACCTPEKLVQIARTPITFTLPNMHSEPEEGIRPEPLYEYAGAFHNELEEFLL